MLVATEDSFTTRPRGASPGAGREQGALGDEVDPKPCVVAQLTDLRRWDEARPEHASLVQLREPDCVELVCLWPPGDVLHIPGVDEPDDEPAGFQQVEERPPVVRGGLDDGPLDSPDSASSSASAMITFVIEVTSKTLVTRRPIYRRMRDTDADLSPMPSPRRLPLLSRVASSCLIGFNLLGIS